MPRYVMLVEPRKCLNCKACVLACQQRNAVPYGCFRNWVRENPDPDAGQVFQPGGCMHCENAPCVHACPTAATAHAPDGRVTVDEALCVGCGGCVRACPYGARFIHPQRKVADKCDYCADLVAEGRSPACVSVCTTRTRMFGDADDPNSAVSRKLADATQSKTLTVVEPQGSSLRPGLRYVGEVKDKHWPKEAPSSPLDLMPTAALGMRWLGGLSLLGVGIMLIKDRITGKNTDHKHHNGGGDKA